MAETPDFLTLRHNRERCGIYEVPLRRAATALVGLVCLAGLLNAFGQRPSTSTAATSSASLDVYAPAHVRGGLYYEARFTIRARAELKKAILVLGSGWAEGTTINTIEPSPIGEASRDGKLVFELGHIPSGQKYVLFLQLQVNPTNVGRRSQDAALYDGGTFLTSIDRTVTVFP